VAERLRAAARRLTAGASPGRATDLRSAAADSADGTTAEDSTAEERRLLFVGMTRARSRLYLSYAAQRARRGAIAGGGGLSPFLAGISPDLLRRPQAPRPRRPDAQQLRLL
jgi:superfamily I DNA/RNA helicase